MSPKSPVDVSNDASEVSNDASEVSNDASGGPAVKVKTEPQCEDLEPLQIVWRKVFQQVFVHACALYGATLVPGASWMSLLWGVFLLNATMVGVTAGTHRLWSHKTYKAKPILRFILSILQASAYQHSIYVWCRDHRVHHKYSETNADPHNAKRGFFFSHIGWTMVKKQQDVVDRGRQLDMSDLLSDNIVMFQHRHFGMFLLLFWFAIPCLVPWYFWGESLTNAIFICVFLRYCASLHSTFFVNSAAHLWGNRPYDKTINPAENWMVSFMAVGEGFHNYHHVFPQDYSTSELPYMLNVTTMLIDACAYLGLAYDRRKVPKEVIAKRIARTGKLVAQA